MIKYLSNHHGYTMEKFLELAGPPLAEHVTVQNYQDFVANKTQALCSIYIFSDLERVSPSDLENLMLFWAQLQAQPHPVRLLNCPNKVLKRVPLLQKLYQEGLNDFNVYAIHWGEIPEPKQFPVFIRQANDHGGSRSELIGSQAELEMHIDLMIAQGKWGKDPIVTEFVDVKDKEGLYWKYGAFRIGKRIIPTHILLEKHWVVKNGELEPSPALAAEELDYVQTNPHEKELMQIFEGANIDYGRIDYGFAKGRLQVFEINTNPVLLSPPGPKEVKVREPRKVHVMKQLLTAFQDLDLGLI